jgi:tetratricopeptide (TPR) repeat protein
VYEKQGRGEEVEQALRQAVRLDPGNLRWHLRLVELLQREGRVIEALRAAEAALQVQPQNERMAEMLRNLRRRLQKGE